MDENLKMISYMIRHDPLLIAGLILIGISGILSISIQLKLVRLGHKFPYSKYLTKSNWDLPQQYLRIRTEQGWSPWPAYLIWPAGIVGVICLLVGLFRS